MKITDLLTKESVAIGVQAAGKEDAINKIVALMAKSGKLSDVEQYRGAVFAREKESTTGVGDGVAIPHGRCAGVSAPGLAAMVLPEGVDYEALDDEPVNIIFLIAAPEGGGSVHIDILSKLSMMLMDEDFVRGLIDAESVDEFLSIIDKAEAAKDAEDKVQADISTAGDKRKILAVTGCPTGIAHTYMAAEALEKAAAELDCFIQVETRGSGGAKNVLSAEAIREADCIIVAADTKVPMERFDGKRLIEVQVSDGISKAHELLDKAMRGDAPIYRGKGDSDGGSEAGATGSVGHRLYKHLMNGVSHMLPFVVGGGILIALAFLIDGLLVDLNHPAQELIDKFGSMDAVKSNFGVLTPYASLFKGIGGVAFNFMLPILAGFIAMSIADRPGLAVGIVGGAMAANGTSGFLGALVAGFLAGYIVKLLMKLFARLPKALDGMKPVLLYPVFGILICGVAMQYVVEPIVGVINTGLNNALAGMSGVSSIALGLLLAGMMAVDMGGPFNKASYAFGIAAIAAGNYNIMAAVMIGGMVPPCAIALATLLFKKKFTPEERKSGPTNFVMGLAFITEGAIPFAASDPFRVIPSCVAGSAIAGAISMGFHCTLMAPHGGIFVFPVVGNWGAYLLALAAGTVVGAVLLGVLKRKI